MARLVEIGNGGGRFRCTRSCLFQSQPRNIVEGVAAWASVRNTGIGQSVIFDASQDVTLRGAGSISSSNHFPADETLEIPTPSIPPILTLPEIYKSRVACVYNTDGKCIGMITTMYKAEGQHDGICPPPASIASEILGLLARKVKLEDKYQSKKIKDSFSRTLPPHTHSTFQEWAYVTQEKMASPLD
eukprot:1160171-Pelagomonas_calceolata.AAC.1